MDAFNLPWEIGKFELMNTFYKGGSAPPAPAPPAPPPSAKQVEIKQEERDLRRRNIRRKGYSDTILAGDGLGEDKKGGKILLGG